MFSSIFVFAFVFASVVSAGPVDDCERQSEVLNSIESACDAEGYRMVCIEYQPGGNDKDGSISHACYENGPKDPDNTGSEDWNPFSTRCYSVKGGDDAVFGVKDGRGCSAPGVYTLLNGIDASCLGPMNVCDGNNVKECKWSFPTTTCDGDICVGNNVCSVNIPCEKERCPCTEYKFLHTK